MNTEKFRVLVADDDEKVARVVSRLLTVLVGVRDENIFLAADGEEAKMIMERNRVDLVISDYRMPKMNGIELLAWIRKNGDPRIRRTGFIMLTGNFDDDLKKTVKKRRAYFVLKPIMLLDLKAPIMEIIKNL